jgi:hypothetical protein
MREVDARKQTSKNENLDCEEKLANACWGSWENELEEEMTVPMA